MEIEVDEPFWTVRGSSLTVTFTVGDGSTPETIDDGDVLIVGPDGERWCANVMTQGRIQKILDRWRDTGECLSGAYLWAEGLVVVREPGVESMVRAVEDLYDRYGDLDGILPKLSDDEE
ncbi:hypothetical protein DF268_14965 [Streptomyces sp. V2]|uniref:Uncharacterized protein n=1 Tax=Streptomyces niveiscabiei TaxID=164115 RepID=A0ABW9I3C1_9ACTN|nr:MULTISPECIES: hypothetical protein [Streptomyces]PWG12777.1 hypothetical protein DF268_14965 [Streptomyces sp. V2]QZZ31483.1 hypothetical protein A7X85_39435 [Streptomyces sp. ST1015]